ncbi:MAG: hypothetical protein EKE20_15575 [Candidatus Symbiopectobacterium sp. Dall1.0]|nr:hypothetical protein [Candidatus Symbiopectobacterium sp. Dall1.0]
MESALSGVINERHYNRYRFAAVRLLRSYFSDTINKTKNAIGNTYLKVDDLKKKFTIKGKKITQNNGLRPPYGPPNMEISRDQQGNYEAETSYDYGR